MDYLMEKHYSNTSLEDIRQSKTRKRKCRSGTDEEEEVQRLPSAMWDPEAIIILGSSESDDEQDQN